MALHSCRLRGTITLNGAPTAATITATPKLPGPDPSGGGLLLPQSKTIAVPATGVIPSTPALDTPGDAGTWPREISYILSIKVGDQVQVQNTPYLSKGETALDLGSVSFTAAVSADHPVDSVNGQTGAVVLDIPTEASDIGAQPAGSYAAASHTHALVDLSDVDTSTAEAGQLLSVISVSPLTFGFVTPA